MKFSTSEDAPRAKLNFGSAFQQRLDGLIGSISPRWQLERMQARAAVTQLHQYAGAETGRDRTPPSALRNPDSPVAQADALAMMRRSQDLGRDSSFIGHLARQYRIYALGDISYIPATGSKKVNQLYRDYYYAHRDGKAKEMPLCRECNAI